MTLGLLGGAGMLLPASIRAAELERLAEDDPTAEALQYKHEAEESARTDESQYCYNCRYYMGSQDDEWAGCQLFPGKAVKGGGWCNTWVAKT